MDIEELDFSREFKALTTYKHFPWQYELYKRFALGKVPEVCDIPTGLGKTSVIPIWILALARMLETKEAVMLPRRLIYVVNRRTVVDQATEETIRLRDRLMGRTELNSGERETLEELRQRLLLGSAVVDQDIPVAISTLRGQFADNAEWRNDPARPAVVVGTVDMVGSRLLFAGYGRGFKSRPLHAGFLGQDALLVHDEAHLEPAFQELIVAIESEQQRSREFRRLRVMALTATSRSSSDEQFTLTEADREHAEVRKRWIDTKKGISFYPVDDEKELAPEVYRRASAPEFKDSGQAILIFLRKLDDLQDVADSLTKAKVPIQRLTGTLRGYERDQLARADAIFARFVPNPTVTPAEGTVYLVCTSAGEVGVNMSADHLVCDLTPFDSMAQRLGRVNRFGNGEARIDVVHCTAFGDETSKKKPAAQSAFDQACERTLLLLQKLPKRADGRYDGSPAALGDLPLEDRRAAFTPPPTVLPTSDILFDVWALTSIREKLPGRPAVADWLHGVTDWEPPETHIAWREEVELITPQLQQTYAPEDLLEDYPLKPHELLRDATSRVFKHLDTMAGRCPEASAWVVESEGRVRVRKLAEVVSRDKPKNQVSDLADCTVLLPPTAGGLEKGMLDGRAEFDDARRDLYDVSDKWIDEKNTLRRCRVWDADEPPGGMRLIRTVDTRLDADDEPNEEEQVSTHRCWRWYVRPRSADDDGSRTASQTQDLQAHSQSAQHVARELAISLNLSETEASAIALAARWHDLGKRRELWQRSIGNRDFPQRVLAKSGHNMLSAGLSNYRHEFGSLIEVSRDAEFLQLGPEVQDLVLHLIAAHHGRARPHFPSDEAFDPDYSDEVAAQIARGVPRRFARLQRKYGWWGLAYLESLVRAADALASQDNSPADSSAVSMRKAAQ